MAFDDQDRKRVRIPVHVQRKEMLPQRVEGAGLPRQDLSADRRPQEQQKPEPDERPAPIASPLPAVSETSDAVELWRDRALRFQAEMENFRKRQQRAADQRVAEERERLVSQFATIVDDLERALDASSANPASLRQGVALTHQALMRLLAREGVEPIHPMGETFDPQWHEAAGTVSHTSAGARPNTVVNVVRDGYRIGDRLVRPAQVVVAV